MTSVLNGHSEGVAHAPSGLVEEWMIERLPPAPARLLLLGEELSLYEETLRSAGYSLVSQSYRSHGQYAQVPTATRQTIFRFKLDDSLYRDASFAAVVVVDYSPAVHPLDLFESLDRLLESQGVVIITGSQTPRMDDARPPRLASWISNIDSIGARCGFAEIESIKAGCRSEMVQGNFVRAFRKSSRSRWKMGHVRDESYAEIAELFQEVFDHPLSRELWEWKYADGRGNAVIARREGKLIAHYGGMYRDILLFGQPEWVFQISDAMVHPHERGVLTKSGPFLLTAATAAEIYGPLGSGFPNARHTAVLEKLGLAYEVGKMAEVRWTPRSTRPRLFSRVRNLVPELTSDQAIVDSLWSAMAQDLQQSVVGVRDWAYVKQRYLNHPHNHYELLLVTSRLTGKPLGVLVLHRLEGSCELLDLIAPLANLVPVIDQARRMTSLWALPYLYCWITQNFIQPFLACGGIEEALRISIPTCCWVDDPRVHVFKDKWWLMAGDTDFR